MEMKKVEFQFAYKGDDGEFVWSKLAFDVALDKIEAINKAGCSFPNIDVLVDEIKAHHPKIYEAFKKHGLTLSSVRYVGFSDDDLPRTGERWQLKVDRTHVVEILGLSGGMVSHKSATFGVTVNTAEGFLGHYERMDG